VANVAVFVGSVRRDRKGIRVAKWIEKKYKKEITKFTL
jgi:NAD(P)H-dependent FMN reductase